MKIHRASSAAFTLIELVISMAIVMLMIGAAAVAVGTSSHEQILREPIVKLKELAKRGRNAAIVEQRPYQIEFTETGFLLSSLVATRADDKKFFGGDQGDSAGAGVIEKYDLPEGIIQNVQRWQQKEDAPSPARQVWIFESTGLCEPIRFTVSGEHGYVTVLFNALDAHVEQTSSEIH